jgi:hypothetical protein
MSAPDDQAPASPEDQGSASAGDQGSVPPGPAVEAEHAAAAIAARSRVTMRRSIGSPVLFRYVI